MERSEQDPDIYTPEEIRAWEKGWQAGMQRNEEAKARFDRFVCAVAQADVHGDLSEDEIAEQGLNLMLAADKRWEEYVKGGQDV
jgi:hypothetical protein